SNGAFLACSVEKAGVQLWNLSALRAQLDELDLDWDLPPLPPAPKMNGDNLQAIVDEGNTHSLPESLSLDEKVAKAYQQAWAERLGVPIQIANSIGMNLSLVHQRPQSFYCGKTKLTVGQYRLFTQETGYKTTAESSKAGGVKIYGDATGQKQ